MNELIVVVDDEKSILELATIHLQRNGFRVETFETGQEYKDFIKKTVPDLTVLDLMLPDIDGFELCKELRRDNRFMSMPIIILSGRIDESDTILGLELGADDYVKKPFSPKELAVRVKTILRRGKKQNAVKQNEIRIGENIMIDVDRYEVVVDDKTIQLTPTEYRILKMLAEKKGKVLNREEILFKLWGHEKIVVDRTVDVHIKHLREKMGPYSNYIKNIRGVGYKIES